MKKHKYIGYKGVSRNYGSFEVTAYIGKGRYEVRFTATGYVTSSEVKEIISGGIKDNLLPYVCGVGYIGEAGYVAKTGNKNTAAYEVWRGVIRRCYDEKCNTYKRYGEKGVYVCKEWHNFQHFAKWYYSQDKYLDRLDLDKDLIDYKAGCYSPSTCSLIPKEINYLFTGKLNKGVYNKRKGKELWSVQLHKGELTAKGLPKQSHLGEFTDKTEAEGVYLEAKIAHVKQVASTYKGDLDERVYNNLTNDQWIKDYIYHLSDQNNKGEK